MGQIDFSPLWVTLKTGIVTQETITIKNTFYELTL